LRTWWERALIPFVFCRLSQLYSYGDVNDPESPAAAANGMFLMIRRDAYERIGGHAAVSGEVLEDVALARRAKAAGLGMHFAPGEKLARVHMYGSFGAMWEGWTKNLCPLVVEAGQKVTRELIAVIPWIPLLCFAVAPLRLGRGTGPLDRVWPVVFLVMGGMLLAGRHASYAAMLRRNRFPALGVIYYLAGMSLYTAALLASDVRYARGKVTWKGREYPVRMPGK